MSPQSPAFDGSGRRLIVAMDVGTTYSGVSYAIVEPGEPVRIRNVTRFPGQSQSAGSSKIPTVMYYDLSGKMRSAGAETTLPKIFDKAEDEGWIKVEWFKLRLRPETMPTKLRNATLPPLPEGKTVTDLFADFFAYLLQCTEQFIKDTHPTLKNTWGEWRERMVFVLAHPNGWEGAQQMKMRNAAVQGGLVPDNASGRSKVVFVSEGEASLHYCIKGGFIDNRERGFIVADLGGGTLDFSVYKVTASRPYKMTEMDEAKCELEGSVIVTQRAHVFLKRKLEGTQYGSDAHLEQMTKKFDETTKQIFEDVDDICHIQFGSISENDPKIGVRGGRLRLTGADVAKFFEPSISSSVAAIEHYLENSTVPIASIYLVGGFSASPYFKAELTKRLATHHVSINTPDGQTVKAVADGAASFFLDHFVTARVSKVAYGVKSYMVYNASNQEHYKRREKLVYEKFGDVLVPDGFVTMVKKGTSVSEETEYRHRLYHNVEKGGSLSIRDTVYAYRGSGEPPSWFDEVTDPSLLKLLCTVEATIPKVPDSGTSSVGTNGKQHQQFYYHVLLFFGGPEIRAQIAWTENGDEKKGVAKIIYEDMEDVQD